MVTRQIAGRGIRDPHVLNAMRHLPRETFVADGFEEFACEDRPLPIGHDQTISQPYIVALMVEAAEIRPGDRVLEIGAGSGYAAALLGHIADSVHTVERHEQLAGTARENLAKAGVENVEIHVGDGTLGWPDAAPYDAILVAAGGPSVPASLKRQLKPGGRLVIPVGEGEEDSPQRLRKLVRTGADAWDDADIGGVRFVPLIGAQGWTEDGRRSASNHVPGQNSGKSLPQMIADAADPLPDIDGPEFGAAFDRYADKRVVLLGEASHGTSEFYRARAAITRHLIENHGFTIVAAATEWGGDMEVKEVRPSRGDSSERVCHDADVPQFLLDLKHDDAVRRRLTEQKLERFIGVIYRPETELQSHYAAASLAQQFDAWVWFDETRAITPLDTDKTRDGVPDTYPFGL